MSQDSESNIEIIDKVGSEIKREDLPKLASVKQELFVKHYLIEMNASKAAILAGYKSTNAYHQGSALLRDPHISTHIQFFLQERNKKLEVKSEDIVRELSGIAFSRITDFVERKTPEEIQEEIEDLDPDDFSSVREYKKEVKRILSGGIQLREFEEFGDSAAALEEIEVNGNGVIHIKTKNKAKALELLGKHIGMWNYESESNGRDRESNIDRVRRALSTTSRRSRERDERRRIKENSGDAG